MPLQPQKAPEPERKVELWIDGKPKWVDFEMKVLCMYYALTGNPETEAIFSSDDLLYVAFRIKDLPRMFNTIQILTMEGALVCERTDMLQQFINPDFNG